MQKKEIVLLCLHKGATSELDKAKPELQIIGKNYAGKVAVHILPVPSLTDTVPVGVVGEAEPGEVTFKVKPTV